MGGEKVTYFKLPVTTRMWRGKDHKIWGKGREWPVVSNFLLCLYQCSKTIILDVF